MAEINFSFTVNTCLESHEVEALQAAVSLDERFQVLNDIFGEDPNIWDAFYEAALEAFNAEAAKGFEPDPEVVAAGEFLRSLAGLSGPEQAAAIQVALNDKTVALNALVRASRVYRDDPKVSPIIDTVKEALLNGH